MRKTAANALIRLTCITHIHVYVYVYYKRVFRYPILDINNCMRLQQHYWDYYIYIYHISLGPPPELHRPRIPIVLLTAPRATIVSRLPPRVYCVTVTLLSAICQPTRAPFSNEAQLLRPPRIIDATPAGRRRCRRYVNNTDKWRAIVTRYHW